MARLLAKAVNCTQLTKEGDVCGECEFCLGVQNGSLLDLVEIDAASNRGIDDIRDLREKVKLLPAQGKKKVYIIDEVHMLTNEAFNALLKTLEEPPKHAVFILCTTEFHKVPETIKSRCQVFKFRRPTKGQIVEKLKRIATTESAMEKIAEEEFDRVATLAGGAFRDAETILQQFIEGGRGGESGVGGTAGGYGDFIVGLQNNNPKKSLQVICDNFDAGADLAVWTDGLLRYLRDALYLKMGFTDDFFALSDDELVQRKSVAQGVSQAWLVSAVEIFNQAQNDLKSYSIQQLALEVAVAKLTMGDNLGQVTNDRPVTPQKSDSNQPAGDRKPFEGSKKGEQSTEQVGQDRTKETKDVQNVKKVESKEVPVMEEASATEDKGSPEIQQAQPKTIQTCVALEIVENRWREVVSQVTKINNSVGALVKSGKPVQVEENSVVLEVSYKFHKERLESSANKKLVEKVLEEIFGDKLGFRCTVCQRIEVKKEGEVGDLTDLNIRIPQDMVITGKTVVTDVFDGGLPL